MLVSERFALALMLFVIPWVSQASYMDELIDQGDAAFYGRGATQSYSTAAERYQLAADLGSAKAAHYLGFMHDNGLGFEYDPLKAVEYYQIAAEADHAPSLFSLGQHAEMGVGLKRNLRRAFQLYRASAHLGYSMAQTRLAFMYAQGLGTSISYSWATYYSAMAASNGDQLAEILLEHLLPQLPSYTTELEYSTLWPIPDTDAQPVGQLYLGSEVYQLERVSPEWMVVYSPEARRVAYLNMMSFIPMEVTASGGNE